ncbi:hypothetical protein HDU67_000557 [Dinochytrium kinnereticum]|nr:hypothetical protein HDU67_000557 [Dinochytrium kinnereticum]
MRFITLSMAMLGLAASALSQNCYNVPDGNIVCSGSGNNTFRICNRGVPSTEVQQCAANLVCCGNSCVAPSDNTCFPPLSPTCKGVADYKTVCTTRQSFNYCLKEKIYAFSADQNCAPGTVCCPSTGLCGFESQCNIFSQPSPVVPAPSPVVTSYPPINVGSCSGVPDFRTTCNSGSTFLYCLRGAPYPNSGPQACAPGTVCCASSGVCDFPGNCRAVPSPTATPGVPASPPSPSPSPSPVVTPPRNSCAGTLDGDIVCAGPDTFNVCTSGAIAATRKCAEGSVCCTTTNRCDFASRCGASGVVNPPISSPAPLPASPCSGVPDGFKVCARDGWSVFTCKSNYILATETCLYGGRCCDNTKTCLAPGSCPGQCAGKPDGHIACTGTSFDICRGGASAGKIACAAGTVCCQAKQTCDFFSNC